MYWLVVEVQGEIGLISLQERYLDKRLEKNPEEIVFYAELTADNGEWNHDHTKVVGEFTLSPEATDEMVANAETWLVCPKCGKPIRGKLEPGRYVLGCGTSIKINDDGSVSLDEEV